MGDDQTQPKATKYNRPPRFLLRQPNLLDVQIEFTRRPPHLMLQPERRLPIPRCAHLLRNCHPFPRFPLSALGRGVKGEVLVILFTDNVSPRFCPLCRLLHVSRHVACLVSVPEISITLT